MKRVIIIVVVMLLVVGGGIAGMMFMDIVPNPFAPSEEEISDGEAGDGGPPAFVPPERAPILYPLEDMAVPVIVDGRVIKRIYITARIEIVPGNRPAVENGLPRMESALNQRLIVYFQQHFTKNRRPNPRGIKRTMVAAAQEVYGEMVSDVILQSIFEQ